MKNVDDSIPELVSSPAGVLSGMSPPVTGPTFVEISWVKFTEEDIARVAERAGISSERVHQYLESDEQDNNILRHFAYFQVYPKGKIFQSYKTG